MMNYAIILAGGSGKRMNSKIKKQYIQLLDKPLLYYTLKSFEESDIDEIVLVVSEEDYTYVKENIIEKYYFRKVAHIVTGGKERHNSVYNGLNVINNANIVLVHDGARPFICEELINKIIHETKKNDAVIAAVPVKDTIKISDEKKCVKETIPRKNLWSIQTPQAFNYTLLKKAYDEMYQQKCSDGVTDDAMVWEKIYPDKLISIVESDYFNIKITTQEDLVIGRAILENKMKKTNEKNK